MNPYIFTLLVAFPLAGALAANLPMHHDDTWRDRAIVGGIGALAGLFIALMTIATAWLIIWGVRAYG